MLVGGIRANASVGAVAILDDTRGLAERPMLLAVVTDDMITRGIRADAVIREVAALAGGRGGGKPHMAQAGIPDAAKIPEALGKLPDFVHGLLGAA